MQTWIEFIDELFESGRIDYATRELLEEGDLEVCPVCLTLNAFDDRFIDPQTPIVSGSQLAGHSWECGDCGATMSDRNALAL